MPGGKGDQSWNGANGAASYWADPQERLVVMAGTGAPGEIRKYCCRDQRGARV
jgi:hypothetical protein